MARISLTSGVKTRFLTALGAAAALLLSGCAANAGSDFDANKDVARPGWQLTYENINPMIKMATVYGDKSKGAHGTFGRFPPNFATPLHTHTGAYHGVVIKGVMTNPFAGEENPPTMEAGSYWYVPAGSPHRTTCVSQVPCEFYFYADQAFDFTPVQ